MTPTKHENCSLYPQTDDNEDIIGDLICIRNYQCQSLETGANLPTRMGIFLFELNKTKYFRLRRYDEVCLVSFSLIAL